VFAPTWWGDASVGTPTPVQGPLPYAPPTIPSWVLEGIGGGGGPGGGIDYSGLNGTSDWDWFISH
jgi:hypothetical protein